MNTKLVLKLLFIIVMLGFLVLMGLNNPGNIDFRLPPVMPRKITLPAAIMYFAFFAIGVLSGAILVAGGKKGGTGKSSKGQGS
ncbi:MAG: hypothetical protein N2487_00155 [Verrucomicrobiae bacterium]|nr:hypothetical protein [Verrucomicrobiae bacterium]